ncbi:MAG: hypothetical protein QXU99_02380 [Candidatus Bathyarchaeia archaeon]
MSTDSAKLASIKTYMMIAFVFTILAMIGFLLGGIYYVAVGATLPSYSVWGITYAPGTGMVITGIVLLVFGGVCAFLFFTRIRKMYVAANAGDVATLKALNNMMWAILALIFAGVLPGIMLLISFGPINELGQAPPPPPPA